MTDAIIIGAGHNGLTCAAYLAGAGKKVLCLEAAAEPGGMAAMHSFAENFKVPGLALTSHPLSNKICTDLSLHKHGYQPGEAIQTIVLDTDGKHLKIDVNGISGSNLSAADRQAYADFIDQYQSFAKALRPFFDRQPPRLKDMDWSDKKTLLKFGWNVRFGLGRESMYDFMRVAASNIYDVLNDTFDDQQLKSYLAVNAIMGSSIGPRTPGSVLTWLHRLQGTLNGPLVMHATDQSNLIDALQKSALASGADIRCNSKVSRILLENDRAIGVELEDGETILSDVVVSSADPRTTFLGLVGAPKLDAMFANRVSQIRGSGTTAKLNLALNSLPKINGVDEQQMSSRFIIAPSMRYIEQAFNHSKYGEYSKRPVLEFTIPTQQNSQLAPTGQHILSVNVAYAPYDLEGGWSQHKELFAQQLISQLGEFIPNLESLLVDHELLTPVDIETQYLATQGHWHHAELSIHQSLMMRPVYGAAQYNTPVDNLFLCGAGSHPGGDLSGIPGHNAAKRILEIGASK